jgi:hypothetical protein
LYTAGAAVSLGQLRSRLWQELHIAIHIARLSCLPAGAKSPDVGEMMGARIVIVAVQMQMFVVLQPEHVTEDEDENSAQDGQ